MPGRLNIEKAVVAIGCLGIALKFDSENRAARFRTKYQEFLRPVASKLDLIVTEVDKLTSYRDGSKFFLEGDILHIRSSDIVGEIDFGSMTGKIEIQSESPDITLEYALRYISAILAVRNGGFLFHGAGIIYHDTGLCFFGPSGSGKTTIAQLSRDKVVLNDDLVMLMPIDQRWILYATPFTHPGQITPTYAGVPLKMLLRLVQDQDVYLESISKGQTIAEIIANIPVLPSIREFTQILISLVEELSQAIPINRLHFRSDDSFWRIISTLK